MKAWRPKRRIGGLLVICIICLWSNGIEPCLGAVDESTKSNESHVSNHSSISDKGQQQLQKEKPRRQSRWRTKPRTSQVNDTAAQYTIDKDTTTTTTITTTICDEIKSKDTSRQRQRRRMFPLIGKRRVVQKDMNWAYTMAVVSSLCYWNYLKDNDEYWPNGSNNNDSMSFRLQSLRNQANRATPQLLPRQHILGHLIRVQTCRLARLWQRILSRFFQRRQTKKIRQQQRRKPCWQTVAQNHASAITPVYYLYDWHEPSKLLGNYHDTDLLLVTTHGGKTLIIAFAGTETAADTITNVQTFEPARHANFFGKETTTRTNNNHNNATATTTTTTPLLLQEGSLHRGFLNALTRVERGYILRLSLNNGQTLSSLALASMDRQYGHCTKQEYEETSEETGVGLENDSNNVVDLDDDENEGASLNAKKNERKSRQNKGKGQKKKKLGCHQRDTKLIDLLRDLIIENLRAGRKVHLTGHSLGGGLATLLAMDILINFRDVPVHNLWLWTFGAPQVADEAFFESAAKQVPRLRHFFSTDHSHRFVTMSDKCHEDIVSNVAQRALAPEHHNFFGKAFRKLGGVRGSVVHFNDPHYLLTPQQLVDEILDLDHPKRPPTDSSTKSAVSAHNVKNYLSGISRESDDHPLTTNLPEEVRKFIGELV